MRSSARKLYKVLRQADSNDLLSDTMQILKEASNACETCMLLFSRQTISQTQETDNIRIKHRTIFDIMFFKAEVGRGRALLYVS